MLKTSRHALAALFALLSLFAASSGPAFACSAELGTNPDTGREEKVWAVFDGQDYEIHWAEKVNGSWSNETTLTDNAVDDACPNLAFYASGATAVTWREDGSSDRIFYRGRKEVSGVWTWQSSALEVASSSNELSAPWIVVHDSRALIAWSEETSSGHEVRVARSDGGSPWPSAMTTTLLRSTSYTSALGVEVRSDGGELWVVWVDSATQLGYSTFDSATETWSSTSYESYAGESDIPAAKQRVEDAVTGP